MIGGSLRWPRPRVSPPSHEQLRRSSGLPAMSMKTKRADEVRILLANVKNDGGPEPKRGVLPERWRLAYEGVFTPLEPDVLAVTEFTYSQTRPNATRAEKRAANRRFKTAQDVLQMRGFRARMGQGRNPTGVFVREQSITLGPDPQRHYERVYRTPPTHVVMTLPEVPQVPINVVSHHAPYCNPPQQLIEGYELTSVVDKVKAHHPNDPGRGAAAWLLGDFNSAPVEQTPSIRWDSPEVTDIVHRCHRAIQQPDGSWVSHTAVDRLLMNVGMHDPARYAALHCNQPRALDPTAGFADSAAGQGGLCRIDRAYMDAWTVQAVTDVQVLDMTGISDHHALLIVLSRPQLVEALRRTFPPLAPSALAA